MRAQAGAAETAVVLVYRRFGKDNNPSNSAKLSEFDAHITAGWYNQAMPTGGNRFRWWGMQYDSAGLGGRRGGAGQTPDSKPIISSLRMASSNGASPFTRMTLRKSSTYSGPF